MPLKPVIPPGLVQGSPTQMVLPGGYTRTPLRPIIGGLAFSGGGTPLTPPTAAPVLSAFADPGSYIAQLSWTASDKTDSAGFGYDVYVDNGYLATTTSLEYDDDRTLSGPGTYTYKVIPKNDAGNGPTSNEVPIELPGATPVLNYYYRRPDGTSRYLRPDGVSFYLRP